MKKADLLRKKYPSFVYEKYSYSLKGKILSISFYFRIEPDIKFKAETNIKSVVQANLKRIDKKQLDNFIFHLGLMEIPTYWKATCSPEIVIEAGYLNKKQIKWWQELIMKGMGQFFYENKLSWQKPKIVCVSKKSFKVAHLKAKNNNSWLVPVGGGKDSIVTLEKLFEQNKKVNAFAVNPNQAVKAVLRVAGIKDPIIVERKIDPKLLELNKKGYLNGHTPFTAVLSFLAVFCAFLFGYKNIAFSNEKSANEGNVKYLGRTVNHQWAKSSEFERMFKSYIRKYLISGINYSSYLRKYSELEIARMFVRYPKYFKAFSSCNVVLAKKLKKRWCGSCPKCLFVYLILYPYLEKKELLIIFNRDLLDDPKLIPILKSLLGEGRNKPFECVGTYKESRKAFKLAYQKSKKRDSPPYLLLTKNK